MTERKATALVGLAFLFFLFITVQTFEGFFPILDGWMGHDFKQALPSWLDGYIWFTKNGWAVPWFTPSFCAGQPFFGDPGSAYYALPQLLAIIFDPMSAAMLTLCISVSVMFWGGYFLMRKGFMTGWLAALLVAGMLMLNGFLPHRMIVGHVVYHGFALVPWIALLLLIPIRSRLNSFAAILMAGLMLAYWVHSGFGTMAVPGAFAILLIALLHALSGGSFLQFLLRGLAAALVCIALAASRLVATLSFLAFFPRTSYRLPGIPSVLDTINMAVRSLFTDSQQSHDFATSLLVNQEFLLYPSEWAYNFGVASALLLVLLVGAWLARKVRSREPAALPATKQLAMLLVLLACLVWPLALNFYEPHWNALLKKIPVINATSAPLRWIVVYIPFIAVGTGLLLERVQFRPWKHSAWLKPIAVTACLLATAWQSATELRKFYYNPVYYSGTVMEADKQLRAGRFPAVITELGTASKLEIDGKMLQTVVNNTIASGMSQLECYNPVFGYRRENFSAKGLSPGPVLAVRDGYLNLKNPACYVYPKENNCKPGDLFKADQIEEARKFVNYQPFAFQFSQRQVWANLISRVAFISLLLGSLAWLGWQLAAWIRSRKNTAAM